MWLEPRVVHDFLPLLALTLFSQAPTVLLALIWVVDVVPVHPIDPVGTDGDWNKPNILGLFFFHQISYFCALSIPNLWARLSIYPITFEH